MTKYFDPWPTEQQEMNKSHECQSHDRIRASSFRRVIAPTQFEILFGRSAVVRSAVLLFAAVCCLEQTFGAWQNNSVFKTSTTRVVLDVVVTDKDDRPVANLTERDFEIFEGGRRQTLAGFEHIVIPRSTRALALGRTDSPGSDVFSNRAPKQEARAFVVVIYGVHPSDLTRTKALVVEFLRNITADDRVAVVYPERSDVSQDFTSDEGLLTRAVSRANEALGLHVGIRWDLFMKNVLSSLSAAPESRRAVVYVSYGMAITAMQSEVTEVFRESKRLNIPIYTVDPRGLIAPELGLEGHMEDQTPERRMAMDKAIAAQQDGMRAIATNTNGLAFVNRWSLSEAVEQLVADNSSYYVVGFNPTPYTADNKFHSVQVKVNRPGLRVRARAGYLAEKAVGTEGSLVSTLERASPGGELQLRAVAVPIAPSARGARTVVAIDVLYPPMFDTAVEREELLQLAWIGIDSDARIRASGQRSVPLRLSAGTGVVTMEDLLDLPKGDLTVRLAVSSRLAGVRGTVHIPIRVPSFDGASPHVTPLLLELPAPSGQRVPTFTGALGDWAVHPTASRVVDADAPVRTFARVYTSSRHPVTADLRLRRGEVTVSSVSVRVTPVRNVEGAIDCEGLIRVPRTVSGEYQLDLRVQVPGFAETHRITTLSVK